MRVRAGLLVLALAFGFARAAGAAPPEPRPHRSEIESLVRRYYVELAGERDSTKFDKGADAILSDSLLFTFGNLPSITRGIAEHKRWLSRHHRVAADQIWTIQDIVVDDRSAAVRFLMEGSHQASFLGVPATGRTIKIRGLDFFRISGGRIVELYRVFDACDFLHQMGVACPPEAPAGANRGP